MSEEINRALGRVESKVDILLTRSTEFDQRLSKVEKRVWYASGMAAVIGFITSHFIGKP